MYNRIIMVGNLTRDIELRYIQSGTAVASSAIATSRKYSVNGEQREEVCFVDITLWGRNAEIANQYLRKGSKVLIEGELKMDTWVDNATGQKRSKHTVTVLSLKMLDSRRDQQEGAQNSYQNPPSFENKNAYDSQPNSSYNNQNKYNNTQPSQPQPQQTQQIPEIDIDEEEIPF